MWLSPGSTASGAVSGKSHLVDMPQAGMGNGGWLSKSTNLWV